MEWSVQENLQHLPFGNRPYPGVDRDRGDWEFTLNQKK